MFLRGGLVKFLTKRLRYEQFLYFYNMKLLHRIFDFYLDASIHVALAVFCLIHVTVLIFGIPADPHLSWFVFFGTIACYNFVKYGVEAEKYILVANRYHKNIQFASFIALGFACYHGYFLNRESWEGLAFLGLISGLYAIPFLPRDKSLRSLGGLKIFIVALVWAGATVILPILAAGNAITRDVEVETFQRFILVLVLLMPFEIRDLKYDAPELRTIPQRFGTARTKSIAILAALLFFLLTFLKEDIGVLEVVGKGIFFLILTMVLLFTRRKQPRYFASFWVEAMPIFWWILMAGLAPIFSRS
ncbi:hypothetical protein K8352_13330 [Flavobacteriaceae bacterium F89]|uniref:Prenyltransferase n=1 Tax=Cerina litoralis TaxID=2874477 RepID=A0AAE3EVA9_9FLAO|nr:hypothetical protein [Cerina litoralis]MCG2461735.1 hypothetical protein [Cerina litoralis]